MVRRPLFYCGISYGVAILVYYYVGGITVWIIACILATITYKSAGLSRRVMAMIAVAFIIGAINMSHYQLADNPAADYIDQRVAITGKLLTCDKKVSSSGNEYYSCKVSVTTINGKKLKEAHKVLASYYNDDADFVVGYIIDFTGNLQEPEASRNPNCFNYKLYLESIGITEVIKIDSITGMEERSTIGGKLYCLKEGFLAYVTDAAGEDTSALLRGILFGDKTMISKDEMQVYQMNSTAHILAVSGLHMGIIYAFIAKLWRGRKGVMFLLGIMAFFGIYCIVASFAPSVVRASCMVILHALAKLLDRRYDLASAAFLIFIAMLSLNPMSIFNSGFQMSFLAVMTMSLLLPYIDRLPLGILTSSTTVQLGLLPYTMYNFNYLSTIGILINIPIIFIAGILLPLGLVSILIYLVCGWIWGPMVISLNGICELMSYINNTACKPGVTVLSVTSPPRWILACYYLCMVGLLSEEGRLKVIRLGKKYVMPALAIILAVSLVFGSVSRTGFENANLVFVDVGQGDSMHIRTEANSNYLIDGGGKVDYDVGQEILRPYLLKNGVKKLKGAFISHLHTDHYKGIASLCKQGMVDRIFLYEGYRSMEEQVISETGLESDQIVYLKKGDIVSLSKKINVEILAPGSFSEAGADYEDENEFSLIMKIYFTSSYGTKTLIVTGDIDQECEEELVRGCGSKLKCDIVKVAHHGSKYSSSERFVMATSPKLAVIQVGTNTYGHPNQIAMDRYEQAGSEIYRNDTMGAIGFNMNKRGDLRAVTMLQR